MSVNSSSSSSGSLLHPNLSTISYITFEMHCIITKPSSLIYLSFCITSILIILPLCIVVLYLGLQRLRQQRSTSTAAMMSHSDSFIYHMVTMELFGVVGYILCCWGIHGANGNIIVVALHFWTFIWFGEMFFHNLTCVERYLAVVHPIIYLGLRRGRGVRIRNISIGCVWLLSFGGTSMFTFEDISLAMIFCILIFSLIVSLFCSFSVLCVLVHPGPGEQAADRERVDQSKIRAFYTIVVILGMFLLRFVWCLIWFAVNVSKERGACVVIALGLWFYFPSALVLPLLFLQRAGTLACCENATKWG